jgi:hypothetical protein
MGKVKEERSAGKLTSKPCMICIANKENSKTVYASEKF